MDRILTKFYATSNGFSSGKFTSNVAIPGMLGRAEIREPGRSQKNSRPARGLGQACPRPEPALLLGLRKTNVGSTSKETAR